MTTGIINEKNSLDLTENKALAHETNTRRTDIWSIMTQDNQQTEKPSNPTRTWVLNDSVRVTYDPQTGNAHISIVGVV